MKRFIVFVTLTYCATLVFVSAQPSGTTLDGQQIFREETFGNEQLWTDKLKMQEALASVSPQVALDVGLKVDADALPQAVVKALRAGDVDLGQPALTIQLLALNAVVGVRGQVIDGKLQQIGITCALCHSTVNDSVVPGVGRRLDGWPNRDLNVGTIIALSTELTAEQRSAVTSWKKGMFDPRLQAFDGTDFIPLLPAGSQTFPVLIPPAFGLQRVGHETVTGDGPISYWNKYVGVTQMGGQGSFSDPHLPFPLNINQSPDLVEPKLAALLAYQLRLRPPEPPVGSFDVAAAQRGEAVFSGVARCSTCHTPPAFTDVGTDATPVLHAPEETGMEPVYASRSKTGKYRTAPLRGVWQHPPYFHDGSAADLLAVVNHYNTFFSLGLTDAEKADLVQFLLSL